MPGRMDFEIEYAKPELQPVARKGGDGPLRILILGDFTGRANRGVIEHGDGLAERPTPSVDLDNLEDVLFRYAPRLHLPLPDPAAPSMLLELRRIDDFHPDRLYRSLDVFRVMRELRERMLDPRTFAAETEALKGAPREQATRDEQEGALLERLLGRRPAERPQPRARRPDPGVDITPFIRDIVRPYVVSAASTDQEHLVTSIDQAIGMQMREVLHQPDFRALEAAWRGVEWLIQRVELDEDVELCLLDASKEELAADLAIAGSDPQDSGLYRLLVERTVRTPGVRPWSLLAGNYVFGTEREDVAVLSALGAVASRAGGPFVAAAAPSVLGCRSLVDEPDPRRWMPLEAEADRRWQALRSSAFARWIGLALPRFLLRLPYGARTEPIEAFAFEEQPARPEHEAYLWGNPSMTCAMLVAAAFAERGWAMQPGDRLEIDDLPAHVFDDQGEPRMTACAETYLTETAAEAILERGIMPLLSYRDRNAARLLRFQSLAQPPAALCGSWS